MLRIDNTEQTVRMQTDLRLGLPIVITKEKDNFLIFSTERISKIHFSLLMNSKSEKPFLCVTSRRAQTLKARVYDNNISRIQIPEGSDINWIQATADPILDLDSPMKGPYITMRGGDTKVAELSLNWCKKAKLIPSTIIKKISNLEIKAFQKNFQILTADFSDLINENPSILIREERATAKIPIKGIEARLRVFRVNNDSFDHCAIEFGTPNREEPVLTRIHSACFTGDVLNSQKCDCGSQLERAIEKFVSVGEGILLYLNQEGRGIGLLNKVRAYKLQEQGYDTVDANHRLGFEDEERDFQIGAEILHLLGFSKAKLMTNNPKKIKMLEDCEIKVVERVSLLTQPTKQNLHYLQTKAKKSGHLF